MLRSKIAGHALALVATILLGGFLSATLVRARSGIRCGRATTRSAPECRERAGAACRPAAGPQRLAFLFQLYEPGCAWRLGNFARLRPARAYAAPRSCSAHSALADRRTGAGLGSSLESGTNGCLVARFPLTTQLTTIVSGTFLCIPAAVLALLSVLWNLPGSLAIALIVFPHIYRYTRNLLAKSYSQPHIITARAKGLGEARILFWHVVPAVAPQLLAVAGVSVSMAIGATIPVEALCGLAGVGQLAWQAALARDLPLRGQYHDLSDSRNLAGKLRSGCNRSHGPGPGIMNLWRKLACAVLAVVLCASIAANWLAPAGYARQYREAADAPPSRAHWLGTDEIGRDRFARVLYGTRISLLLAPAAALLSTLMAALIGGLAGYLGGIWARGRWR